uniref:Uncharacterized protein n=1 Tax=uncultured prokaryote TaxID=198431 RepID=A0A0H5Q7F3_9ZZZZ|nr:hypothetical protein [uncultured prokaryote]
MTDYRMVARHVRYWRGLVHHWSTVWPFTGTLASGDWATAILAIQVLETGVCWGGGSAGAGGLYEIALYDQATGGVPIAVENYFDPDTPGDWVAYVGDAWPSGHTGFVSAAEVALQVEWRAGLSSSGKPVYFRKWFHSVPNGGGAGASVDVNGASQTAIEAYIQAQTSIVGGLGAPLGRGSRLAATTPTVAAAYGNHQMPRGRRRKLSTTKAKESVNYQEILEILQNSNPT